MHFEYRQYPWKILCMYYWHISTFLVRTPYWYITAAFSSWRPRKSWNITRTLFVRRVTSYVGMTFKTQLDQTVIDVQAHAQEPQKYGFVWVDGVPESYLQGDIAKAAIINHVKAIQVPGYWHSRSDGEDDLKYNRSASSNEKVLYVLHGGGFVMGTVSNCDPFIGDLLKSCSGTVTRAFGVDYRLSSAKPFKQTNPFPAALIDALAGYAYLVKNVGFNPNNIVVEGDSAGGQLAVTLVKYLKDAVLPGLPPPGGLLAVSPSSDWAGTHDGPNSSMTRHQGSDFVYHFLKSGYTARALLGELPEEWLSQSVWLSPASKMLKNSERAFVDFPPTCILVGGDELALDSMRSLRDKMTMCNDEERIYYLEYPDAIHDFVLIPWHEPERSQALEDCTNWIKRTLVTVSNNK